MAETTKKYWSQWYDGMTMNRDESELYRDFLEDLEELAFKVESDLDALVLGVPPTKPRWWQFWKRAAHEREMAVYHKNIGEYVRGRLSTELHIPYIERMTRAQATKE